MPEACRVVERDHYTPHLDVEKDQTAASMFHLQAGPTENDPTDSLNSLTP
jgi:hypothetical protein